MRSKIITLLCAILTISLFMFGSGCKKKDKNPEVNSETSQEQAQQEDSSTPEKLEITGVTFEDVTTDYDGNEHEIKVKGTIPTGVSVAYTNNKGTNAGSYNATATLTGDKYKTKTLNASLIINKIDLTGLSMADVEVKEDGNEHHPEIAGTIPTGATIKYYFDDTEKEGVSAIGTYVVKAVVSHNNYNDLTLTCSLKIKANLVNIAKNVIDSFGTVPDPWTFMPETFKTENRVTNAPILDYADFTAVSSIPKNGMGKQLNMVYGIMNKASVALGYVNTVYKAANTVKNLYTEFIDKNPENYKHFEGDAGPFGFSIDLTESEYLLKANISKVNVAIYSDVATKVYGAKVQLTDTTVLKYTVSENSLLIALNVLNVSSTQIEFVRENNNVVGYIYEYLSVAGKEIVAASAMMTVTKDYTSLIGTKGDFAPTTDGRNCEVYRNSDGHLVGTEVRETQEKLGTFNTLWYNLYDVVNINNIKKVDNQNGSNPDTIYINNGKDAIHSKLMGLSAGAQSLSRRFDIEFKTMYFYKLNSETQEYEEVKMEIPLIFVQESMIDDFENDFTKANKDYLGGKTVSLNVSKSVKDAVEFTYYQSLKVYDKIKDTVTRQSIIDYCTK